ncbi:hypothetical protein P154DRAFT_567497 [Amniculicola lignicola CBS 123094]|uniref:Protein kinase domain-containing protein n=1 Tax=Amniculicola lignicola CBS 123094 TaxID=1392246 RepID=A0A6A5W506_9PLEO|nr:hypothetical protein P154DRAFT_567497 [Amniculicola lignicola CBS 123094]
MHAPGHLVAKQGMAAANKMHILDTIEVGCMYVALCLQDDTLFVAGTTKIANNVHSDPSSWMACPPRVLNLANIYPTYADSMTKCTADGPDIYMKRPNYLSIAQVVQPFHLSILLPSYPKNLINREVQRCEAMRKNPHPNVAVYHGVDTAQELTFHGHKLAQTFQKEVVTGLCFKKYDSTLQDLVDNKEHFNAKKVLEAIEAGIRHLHYIGFVHFDIKPENIFHADGEFVIGDFDSMHEIGQVCRLKGGTIGWMREQGGATMQREDDWYSFGRIKLWLEKKGSGHPDESGYPSTEAILKC